MIQPNNRIHIGKSYKDKHFSQNWDIHLWAIFWPWKQTFQSDSTRVWMITAFCTKYLIKTSLLELSFNSVCISGSSYQAPSHWKVSHVCMHAFIQTTLVEQFIALLWVRYPARQSRVGNQWHGPDFRESLEDTVRYINTTQGSVTVGPQVNGSQNCCTSEYGRTSQKCRFPTPFHNHGYFYF